VASVRALETTLDEASALALFKGAGWLARLRGQQLSRAALVLVPFWTFEVTIETVSFRDRYRVAFDSLEGGLDPYRAKADAILPLTAIETANRPESILSEAALRDRVIEFARREVYLKGFGRIRDLKISATRVPSADFHVPYWLGFYETGSSSLELKVVNAHSGKREGKKAVELFHHWLTRK
jgi:hypothetical protein